MTCFTVLLPRLIIYFPKVSKLKLMNSIVCIFVPGPLAPPGSSRPSRKMTALSYSCTTCNNKGAWHEAGWARGRGIENSKFCIFCYRFQIYPDPDSYMVAGGRATSLFICRCLFCCDGEKSEISLLCNAALSIRLKMMPSIQFS